MINFFEFTYRKLAFKRHLHSTKPLLDMTLELVFSAKCFEGEQRFYSHNSETVKCKMNLGVYLPPKVIKENIKCPVLYFLNGRNATHENFVRKSGFHRFCAEFGLCVVSPDTSPRDVDVPINHRYGPSASFYIDALKDPWKNNYQMFTYVTKELIDLINNNLPVIKNRQSIAGLSMGGFGALNCFLKNPGLYKSVSVFAPVCNPLNTNIGREAFQAFIGDNEDEWRKWDPCELVTNYSGDPIEILIDQGSADHYLLGKLLLPDNFLKAASKNDCVKTIYKEREGYDHSHYFLATFIGGMINFFEFTYRKLAFKRHLHSTKPLLDMALELVYSAKCFDGEQRYYSHASETVKCKMNLGVYLPPKVIKENIKCPVLYFLNCRTGTYENLFRKSGFHRFCAEFGLCVVSPDTSPRDVDVPNNEHYGYGPSASFYIDALKDPWKNNYQMFTYVTKELIDLINNNLPVIKNRQSIAGLSMGGFGALNCFLKNPGLYKSVSVFAPVCNPIKADEGREILQAFIGENEDEWKKWDPCELVASYSGDPIEIFIDQGTADHYLLGKFLLPENFVQAASKNDCVTPIFKEREGYDHSHYFLATFIAEHIKYHAKFLNCE